MDNIPRLIFYFSGVLLLSSTFTLLSSEFMVKMNDPGIIGILFLLGYGLIYMNLTFISSRRFMRRLNGINNIPYLFGMIVALPPVAWIHIYDTGLYGPSFWLFIFVVLFGCGLGAYFGQKAGMKAQVAFHESMKKYYEEEEKVPDDLKRPHDTLNKN
ncbi:hypothetical protein AB2B38_006430 [Balneola sp. MJW-20]|uniref:hypothetical protein n=1 Tax=Gracilimonas aurantiaca TaxID=3234185 RepID=UPI00346715E4